MPPPTKPHLLSLPQLAPSIGTKYSNARDDGILIFFLKIFIQYILINFPFQHLLSDLRHLLISQLLNVPFSRVLENKQANKNQNNYSKKKYTNTHTKSNNTKSETIVYKQNASKTKKKNVQTKHCKTSLQKYLSLFHIGYLLPGMEPTLKCG